MWSTDVDGIICTANAEKEAVTEDTMEDALGTV